MKIKIFIVTYKNEEYLKNNILSLLNSDLVNCNYQINVINNFTGDFSIREFCKNNNIVVYDNYLRPDFSTGHLSRNWNQAIINGFKSIEEPDCDILVLCQNDNVFKQNWCEYIIEKHKIYDFISIGGGDQYHSYKVSHIKKVGLWDERFCNIGYQEADYFIRSFLYNGEKSSINDFNHKRILNQLIEGPIKTPSGIWGTNRIIDLDDSLKGGMRNDVHHIESSKYHNISKNILEQKWGLEFEGSWTQEKLNKLPKKSKIPNFIFYPYFEKNVENLQEKGYVV